MAHVRIDIRGDGSGFHKVMTGVEHRISGLKSKVGFSFGETFAALAGGATIAAMVNNMANFAKEISNASNNLGITTQRVQQLRQAARHGGKDLDVFAGIFTKSEAFASKAMVHGSKEENIAKILGITPNDLSGPNGLSKDALLNKMLKGTAGKSRNEAEQLLGNVVGKKNAGFLYGNKEELLNPPNVTMVKDDDIEKMVELKESFEDLTDVVRVALIPSLMSFVEWLTKGVAQFIDTHKDMDSLEREAESIYAQKHNGQLPSGAKSFFNQVAFNTANLFERLNPLASAEEKQAYINKAKRAILAQVYGADVVSEAEKTYTKPVSYEEELAKRAAARRKTHQEEQAEMAGPTTREMPVTKASSSSPKLVLDNEIKGSSANLVRIGALMGTDAVYRLERVGLETNNLLRELISKIAPPDDYNRFEMPESDNY